GSLVTDVKKTFPKYQHILNAVSARDILLHERADAVGSLRLAAREHYLDINVRILQLRRIEGLIEKEISGEIIKLENASLHESTLAPLFDFKLRDLFERLESHAINPEHVSSIPLLEDALVGNESLKGKLAFYLVDYLAKHGLPEMPKALSLLKSVWAALKNSLSRQPPTTLQPSTAAPSLDDELATWFNPYIHTPADFIDQWVTLQTQQAGLTGDYRNVSVGISYKIVTGISRNNFNKKITEHKSTLKLRTIASRQYLKKKREQRWFNFMIDWPSEFSTALRAKIEGGAWEDFNKFIVKFIKHDSFEKGTNILRLIAQGIAGKKLDEKTGDNVKNRPRMIIFTAPGVKTPLAGAFELDDRIYSLSNTTSYQAPQEYNGGLDSGLKIPEPFSTLVKQGLSNNELDKLDNNLLHKSWKVKTLNGRLHEQWPYFTYKECEPGEFSSKMMKRFVQRFDDDMDRTTYSHWEQDWDTAAMYTELILKAVALPIGVLTGPWVGVGMALLSTVPNLIRTATADTQEESKKALNALFLGLLLDLAGEALTPALKKVLGKIAERKAQKLLQDISSQPHAPVIKLEDLENWAIEVRGKVKGRLDVSDAEADDLAAWDGLGNVPQAALAETPIARSPAWKIADFSEPKQPDPSKWVRTDGRLHKAPVESVCHTGRGKRSLCTTAKNYQPPPALSMASMARPSNKIYDWGRDVQLFINDLQTQRVKVLFSLDDRLSGETLSSGKPKDSYLKERLKQSDIEYVIEPKNAIEDGYSFEADADFTQPGPARRQVEQIQSLVDQINTKRQVNPNYVVGVHCGFGDGRSGTVKSAVMIDKLWREQPGRYRQGVVDDNKPALIHTSISHSLDNEFEFDNKVYQVVADAIDTVRKTHVNAVERMDDVNLLNAYARSLLNRP
ncbi:hypothetical protein ACCC84_23200, partial [Serratia odorifera]